MWHGRGRAIFIGCAAFQNRQLFSRQNLIEVLGFASRLDVKIRVVARHSRRLHGIVGVVGGQLLQLIEDLLADEIALFHPSHLAGRGAHLDEVAVVVEHFDAVAIFYELRLCRRRQPRGRAG